MNSLHISYTSRPDAAPEVERSTLAAVYRFILECSAKKAAEPASEPDGRDDVKESNGYVATEK